MEHPRNQQPVTVIPVGGPTAIVEIGGLRLLTDPTFDPPRTYESRPGVFLRKLTGPAIAAQDLGRLDAVLLSHDHHKDNLDEDGREVLGRVPHVLTTVSGAERLGSGATPLPRWSTVDLERPGGAVLHVTGVPAQHGPDGTDHLTGEVTGFVLAGDNVPTVYVSGDNASLPVVQEIVDRLGPFDLALLFAGGARVPDIDGFLTLSGAEAGKAAAMIGAPIVIALHVSGWEHFSEGWDKLEAGFAAAGVSGYLIPTAPGAAVTLPASAI